MKLRGACLYVLGLRFAQVDLESRQEPSWPVRSVPAIWKFTPRAVASVLPQCAFSRGDLLHDAQCLRSCLVVESVTVECPGGTSGRSTQFIVGCHASGTFTAVSVQARAFGYRELLRMLSLGQRVFRSNSVARRWSLRVVKSSGLSVPTALHTFSSLQCCQRTVRSSTGLGHHVVDGTDVHDHPLFLVLSRRR